MPAEAGFRLSVAHLAGLGDAPALTGLGGDVRYVELAERAAGLGDALARVGARPGDRLGIVSTKRGLDEPVALAGVLCAGAVAVPLDAGSPPPRLARILGGSGARAVVCDEGGEALARESAGGRPLVVLGSAGEVLGVRPGSGELDEFGVPEGEAPAELAAILHTSGSTGAPKPVPIRWEGLDAFTAWASDLVGLGPGDRVLRVAELTFDLALFDHVATLRRGASLALASRRELASGRSFEAALARLEPTVIYGVPSLFMKVSGKVPPSVRAVFFAGEVFPPRELLRFSELLPADARLFNFYGPTETNVCTFHEVERSRLSAEREVPLGRACPYAFCELVGEDGRAFEGPGLGELRVSGPTALAGGPFPTRDRVLRGEDGLFYFRGRLDRMLKVRGYRVDPGEVEAALAQHPEVRQAAVVGAEDPRLGKILRAVVALADGAAVSERDLRAHVAALLPAYMVPEKVELAAELPRTATGKTDYGAL